MFLLNGNIKFFDVIPVFSFSSAFILLSFVKTNLLLVNMVMASICVCAIIVTMCSCDYHPTWQKLESTSIQYKYTLCLCNMAKSSKNHASYSSPFSPVVVSNFSHQLQTTPIQTNDSSY